jgi:hypothetical protein
MAIAVMQREIITTLGMIPTRSANDISPSPFSPCIKVLTNYGHEEIEEERIGLVTIHGNIT